MEKKKKKKMNKNDENISFKALELIELCYKCIVSYIYSFIAIKN